MAKRKIVAPMPVRRTLNKLGSDIRDARRRRRIPARVLAARINVSRTTLRRVENGDLGVLMGTYATALFVLGLLDRLGDVADPSGDTVGLELEAERLPERVRVK
jgi:transcriptional regulator with XRE-family HTH domain